MKTLQNISIEVKAIATTLIVIVAACCAFVAPDYIKQNKEKEIQLKQCEARMDSLIATIEFAEGIYTVMPLGKAGKRDLSDHGDTFELVKAYEAAYNYANDSIMPIVANYDNDKAREIDKKYEEIRKKLNIYSLHQYDLFGEDVICCIYIEHYEEGKYTEKQFKKELEKQEKQHAEHRKTLNYPRWNEI